MADCCFEPLPDGRTACKHCGGLDRRADKSTTLRRMCPKLTGITCKTCGGQRSLTRGEEKSPPCDCGQPLKRRKNQADGLWWWWCKAEDRFVRECKVCNRKAQQADDGPASNQPGAAEVPTLREIGTGRSVSE